MSPNLLEAYRRAFLIRHVEMEISRRYHPSDDRTDSPMRTPCHLSVGQETIAVGVAMAIEDAGLERHVWFGHRSHAPYLAFGGNLNKMIAELYGKATGCSGGVGGSMHLHDKDAGLMGGTPIVGSAVSLATGSAWAAKLEGSKRLTVVFCGDAVPETGQFWESLNFASLHGLRLLYVIEDNGLSTATPKGVRSGGLWHTFADTAGELEHFTTDVCRDDWQSVYDSTRYVINDLPGIQRVKTTRACAHVGPEIDHEALARRDPVADLAPDYTADIGPTLNSTKAQIERDVETQIANAFAAAEAAPWPVPEFTHHDFSQVEQYTVARPEPPSSHVVGLVVDAAARAALAECDECHHEHETHDVTAFGDGKARFVQGDCPVPDCIHESEVRRQIRLASR